MTSAMSNIVSTGLLAAALAAGPAGAMDTPSAGTALGAAGPAERVINVGSSTRWINVAYGETVKFIVGSGGEARTFVWRFDGNLDKASLSALAPQGVAAANVPVYIDQGHNPMRSSVFSY